MTARSEEQKKIDLCLWLALSTGEEARVPQYLDAGADPNVIVQDNQSCLGLALQLQMFDFAELMIRHHGGDPAFQADPGVSLPVFMSSMMLDVLNGQTARIAFLVRMGADLTKGFIFDGRSADARDALAKLGGLVGTLEEEHKQSLKVAQAHVEAAFAEKLIGDTKETLHCRRPRGLKL
jgi:hypothetical protein